MNELAKRNQNYFLIPAVMLQLWFEKMNETQIRKFPLINKTLPAATEEEKLNINFSDWDNPSQETSLVIEEYLWGVRCGVMQYVNVDNCSLASVLAVARTDQMCEIYSPAKVQYFLDGSRKIVTHDVSVYNTDAKFSCYSLIDLTQAVNLFPLYREIFAMLPEDTKFLCSPNADKIRIANQEKGERGFSFNAVDTDENETAFYLGNLRSTFSYIAREIEAGKGLAFCNPHKRTDLDYLKSKICFLSGSNYSYNLAMSLATEAASFEVRQDYIQKGINGKSKFSVLINGNYVVADSDFNQFMPHNGQDISICVPPSVYQSWGKPFTQEELDIIHANRTFDFSKEAERDYFNKVNRLRFDQRQINIYRSNSDREAIIEVEQLKEIIKEQQQKTESEVQSLIQTKIEPIYVHRDLSGPSRSSIYTKLNL